MHLNDLGQLAMAVAILKGLGAPAEVSAAVIDAAGSKVETASGCKVSNVKSGSDGVEFDRLDEGLPLNFGTFGALNFMFIPIPAELNGYRLTVRGLEAGKYDLRAGGRLLGEFTAKQLGNGLNISSMTANGWEPGGPWDAQAAALKMVTDARMEIVGSQSYREAFMSQQPGLEAIRTETKKALEQLEVLQRHYAAPVTVHFEVKKNVE